MSRQGSLFKITISTLIVLIVVFYTIFNTRLIIKGPSIEVFELQDGQKLEADLVNIRGLAKNISFISLNGRQIFIDENSEFNERLLLTNEFNEIEIYAEDKFGKKEIKKLTLVRETGREDIENQIDIALDKFDENEDLASSTKETEDEDGEEVLE